MQRRQFISAAAIAAISTPVFQMKGIAHQSTSPASDVNGLSDRVTLIAPERMLDTLLTTPVTTALFPSDTDPVEPVPWDDASDDDLDGTIGAVAFNTGYDDNDNFIATGNVMVHPDTESAAAFVAATGEQDPPTFLGLPWITFSDHDYAVSAVQIGYLILVGGAETPSEELIARADPQATPATESGTGSLTLRAISHMTALLDHLEMVVTELGA